MSDALSDISRGTYYAGEPGRERIPTPNTCEYEKKWETICRSQTSTDPKDSLHYISYSCALCFCRHPERECNVKRRKA